MKLLCVCIVLCAVLGLSRSALTDDSKDLSESSVNEQSATQDKNLSTEEETENKPEDENDPDGGLPSLEEESEDSDEKDKRFGSILGKGFSFGKRIRDGLGGEKQFGSILGNGMSFGKRFGSILGHGMSFGKRFGSILGKGMKFGKRYGFVLGNGYSFGKRQNSDLDLYQSDEKRNDDNSISDDIEFVDYAGPVDEKKWVLNKIYGGGYPIYKRSKRDTRSKRYIHYFGNMLGRGFTMGKREDMGEFGSLPEEMGPMSAVDNTPFPMDDNSKEMDIDGQFAKRLGTFGQWQRNFGRDQRRYLGNVLGRGFSFGKRGFDAENDDHSANEITASEKYYEESPENSDIFPYKRYFHSSPGYRFGKRDMEERDKRFGFILGRGLFGKRQPLPPKKKRPYGFVLGRGYSLGKRAFESMDEDDNAVDNDEENTPDLNKKDGFVLSRGYELDKRGYKRFGWILGNGLSFGKRDGMQQNSLDDISLFIDEFGNAFVRIDLIADFDKINAEYLYNTEARFFGCAGQLIPHETYSRDQLRKAIQSEDVPPEIRKQSTQDEVNYFIDHAGNIYVKADDISESVGPLFSDENEISYLSCDGHLTEILGDHFDEENVSKRGWGNLLGRGFRFGKRFGSKKRFGHILGNGFSWGK